MRQFCIRHFDRLESMSDRYFNFALVGGVIMIIGYFLNPYLFLVGGVMAAVSLLVSIVALVMANIGTGLWQ